MSTQMSTQSGQLVSNSRSEEEIRRKRRKQKRVVVVLEVSIMAIIANRYQRRRPRHIVDLEEALERNVEGRKQMLRNLYQGSNRYCYDSLRLTKRSFGDLCAILRVSHEFIKLPDPAAVLPEDPKWKWFEDCLGALDGTHIDVNVPLADQGSYRNRKQRITTNVLGVCDRNMMFLYVLAAWEGSASDSRILCDAMSREDSFVKSSRGYVPWNDEMDKVLFDTFVEYFNKGDRCQNGWKPHVYSAAVKNVREKCNVNITKCNIDSRSKTSDKQYHVISGLLSTSGFGWDWNKNKLKVDSDSSRGLLAHTTMAAVGIRLEAVQAQMPLCWEEDYDSKIAKGSTKVKGAETG
ncbi:hypothetical protein EJB05_47412, partial [Eragrostis curvula]